MRKFVIGAAAIAGLAAPAAADVYVATIKGVVTEQFDTGFTAAGATSPIKVGDTMTATFSYMPGESVGAGMAMGFGKLGPNRATFELAGFKWTSAGDFAASFEPVAHDMGPDPLASYYSTMDDAPGGGDLRVNGYAFTISDFGYDLYTGPGFAGRFDRATLTIERNPLLAPVPAAGMAAMPIPEPAAWALMISGFGLIGGALRRRRATPALA